MNFDDPIILAFHESGHVCIARRLGFGVDFAQIKPEPGTCITVIWPGVPRLLHRAIIRQATAWVAGPAAERRLNEHLWASAWDGGTDRQEAEALLSLICGDADHRERMTATLIARADHLVREDWTAIQIVADALLRNGGLSGAEINTLLSQQKVGGRKCFSFQSRGLSSYRNWGEFYG